MRPDDPRRSGSGDCITHPGKRTDNAEPNDVLSQIQRVQCVGRPRLTGMNALMKIKVEYQHIPTIRCSTQTIDIPQASRNECEAALI